MGPQDSAASIALLDATERVMRDDGYAAVTSRRIAQEAGLKQQLVYYYFHTMEDLLLATFKRRTERALAALEEELAGDRPVEAIWNTMTSRIDTKLSFEFVAIANHHEGIRREVARYIAESRKMQTEAIARQFKAQGIDSGPVTPGAAVFLMYSVSLILGREAATGITDCHEDVRTLIDWALGKLT